MAVNMSWLELEVTVRHGYRYMAVSMSRVPICGCEHVIGTDMWLLELNVRVRYLYARRYQYCTGTFKDGLTITEV